MRPLLPARYPQIFRCLAVCGLIFAHTPLAPTAIGQGTADLSLRMSVERTDVHVGDTLTVSVYLRNDGPDDARRIRVDWLGWRLDMIRVETANGNTRVNSWHGRWEDVALDAGDSTVVVITAVVEKLPTVLTAGVQQSSARDPDSRPGRGVAEDDNATLVFSDAGTSGGGDGGLESGGRLAGKLARVLFDRSRSVENNPGLTGVIPPVYTRADSRVRAGKTAGATSLDIRFAIPEEGPDNTTAREVSPADLLPVTNAVDLVAVDYTRDDGRRVGVVFAAATEAGQVYEHTKVVCDRLRGASLEAIERITINDHVFVGAQLVQESGAVDYATSFVVYDRGDHFEVDSRFVLRDYDPPATGQPVLNYQVWSETREDMLDIAAQMLDELAAVKPVLFAGDSTPPALPDVYIRTGNYREGRLELEVVNRAAATMLHLGDGTKTLAENGERVTFTSSAPLAEVVSADSFSTTVLMDIGPVFDADFAVTTDSSFAPDLLYLADGSWSWAVDSLGSVDAFAVAAADPATLGHPGTYAVERGGSIEGSLAEWATLFRFLRPGGAAVDLSDYRYVEFTASGEGRMRVQLEKAGLVGEEQFGQTVQLTEEPRTYRFWFDQLVTREGAGGFSPEDVFMLSFNAERAHDGTLPSTSLSAFAVNISNVRFRGDDEDVASERPIDPILFQSYPNPVSGVAYVRFDLPEAARARVSVFDALGRRVALLTDSWRASGPHTLTFDASNLATGVYYMWLESDVGFRNTSLVVSETR